MLIVVTACAFNNSEQEFIKLGVDLGLQLNYWAVLVWFSVSGRNKLCQENGLMKQQPNLSRVTGVASLIHYGC